MKRLTATDRSVQPWRLRRHLMLAIAFKLAALTAIWWWFFRADLRSPADSEAVATQILQTENALR